MRPYEVMVIYEVGSEEADIRKQVDRVIDLVRSRGGIPGRVDYWGRRTFAYEVKHRSEGYYVLIEAVAEPTTMSEVDRLLVLEDSVLRYKIIRQPGKASGRRRVSRPRGPVASPAGESSEPVPAPSADVAADDESVAS